MTRPRRPRPAAALRRRIVLSLVAAALVPFAAAWWIASEYVSNEERQRADLRLELALSSALASAGDAIADLREQALLLARDADLQRALVRRDREALDALLLPGEGAILPDGSVAGEIPAGVPRARVRVTAGGRRAGTVVVAAPETAELLRQLGPAPVAGGGEIALARAGVVVAGPSWLLGARVPAGTALDYAGERYRVRVGVLPGFADGAHVLVALREDALHAAAARLRRELALAGALSLTAIGLLALALARPLLHGIGLVEEVAEQAELDALTGLANRRGLDRALEAELDRAARYDRPCALVLADLDDFKQVNDRHGHEAGDEVLRALAEVLRRSVRGVDLAARLGGEELALLLPETDVDGAVRVAERVRRTLEEQEITTAGGVRLRVTASFGAAAAPPATSPARLLRAADAALYAAKRAGKNRVARAPARSGGEAHAA